MDDLDQVFPGKYLKPADLSGQEVTVTIANAVTEEVGQSKDRRPVISLVGHTKRFVLNVTNANAIAALYGRYYAGWLGKVIVIFPTTTSFGGKTVDCIRVKAPPAAAAPAAAPPPAPAARPTLVRATSAAPPAAAATSDGMDEAIPF